MSTGVTAPESLTLKEYYKSFYRQWSSFVTIPAALMPIASIVINSPALFPPLGDSELLAKVGASLVPFLVVYLTYFEKYSSHSMIRKVRYLAFFAVVFFFVAYFGLYSSFVRVVPVPSRDASVRVCVGYERTSFAQTQFGAAATDLELLRARGFTEEEIRRLWTWKSLLLVRIGLLFSYTAALAAFNLIFSLGALDELMQQRRGIHPD